VKAIAPGKLLLTGAYAVLDGAPAVVMAVDRHATADATRVELRPSAEIRAAFGNEPAPAVDVLALHDAAGRKLGLGSSAAALVACLGARALSSGQDLREQAVRSEILRLAREAHARAQNGGSGVDVAASVYGGVLRYSVGADGVASVCPIDLPRGLCVAVYDSGTAVRTSEMRSRVDALRSRPTGERCLAALRMVAERACEAIAAGDAPGFVACAREFGDALAAVGREADAPIVPPRFAALAALAAGERAAFIPSGAGGGDVAVWLGLAAPSGAFAARAGAASMVPLPLGLDWGGVRAVPPGGLS
jgi:phosphomevalonate kinase